MIESDTALGGGTAAGLAGILMMLGGFLKHHVPGLNSDWIPVILLAIAVPTYIALTWPPTVLSVVMAFGAALSAVGMHSGTRSTVTGLQGGKQ